MKCQVCKHDNNSSAAYCKNCGSPLKSHKTCKSGHNYDASLNECPYCPSPNTMGSQETLIDSGHSASDKTMISPSKPRLNPQNMGQSHNSDKTMIFTPGASSAPAPGKRKLVGWLVTFDLDPAGNDFRLTVGKHKIGRGSNNEVMINQQGVSESHATLLYRAGRFLLKDELSVNGTFVNGEMAEDTIELFNGDIITVGAIDLKLIII